MDTNQPVWATHKITHGRTVVWWSKGTIQIGKGAIGKNRFPDLNDWCAWRIEELIKDLENI